MKRILAYVDERIESERAAWIGAEIARRNQGSLTALAVVEPAALAFDGAGASLGSGGLAKTLLDANEERLAAIAARAQRNGVDVAVETRIGAPWLEVSRSALRSSGDLVIKVARGRRRLGWPLFGSTALHLVRKCPAPIWLAAPDGSLLPRRILAVVNPLPGAAALNRFEGQVLARAAALADLLGAELDILCCWQLAAVDLLATRLDPHRLLQVLDGMRDEMQGMLDTLIAPFLGRIAAGRVHLEKGPMASVATTFVDVHAIDLIVLGSVPPEAGVGILIREDVEDLIQRTSCSILAIKPDGFRSPVRLEDG